MLDAQRTYITKHSHGWDLCTDVLEYGYYCQPHTPTTVAPFKAFFSKPPGSLALNFMISNEAPRDDLKQKWKHWLQKMMKN